MKKRKKAKDSMKKRKKAEGSMKQRRDILSEHRKHMLTPKPEWLRDKLKMFKMKTAELKPLPPICNVPTGSVYLNPEMKFEPHVGELSRYIRTITPRNIFELKELVGIPNRVFEKNKPRIGLRKVQKHHLPVEKVRAFKELQADERIAVRDAAHNLLYGYVDNKTISKPPFTSVVEFMLERARFLASFITDSLIVCPNEIVHFNNFAVVYITNVVVYGSGTIRLGNNCKLHSYHIKHV
jgi:hypothetical protein